MIRICICSFILLFNYSYAGCTLPEDIKNKDILMINTSSYTPDNPMSGEVYMMHYKSDDKYHYETLRNGRNYNGTYRYQRISTNIAIIAASENFAGTPAQYTLTLICDNQNAGSYFYQQDSGIGGIRANSAQYYFVK